MQWALNSIFSHFMQLGVVQLLTEVVRPFSLLQDCFLNTISFEFHYILQTQDSQEKLYLGNVAF
jgi:hypothetical protein